jgi:hypothetical protein
MFYKIRRSARNKDYSKNAFVGEAYRHMCIKISPMQDLYIYKLSIGYNQNVQVRKINTAHQGAAGELLLHTCLHEKDRNAFFGIIP